MESTACRTRDIHWKLSSSEQSGLCSATTHIRSSLSTRMENTAMRPLLKTNSVGLVPLVIFTGCENSYSKIKGGIHAT